MYKRQIAAGDTNLVITVTDDGSDNDPANTVMAQVLSNISVGDIVKIGNSSIGTQYIKVKEVGSATDTDPISTANLVLETKNTLGVASTQDNINRFWEYYNVITGAPSRSDWLVDNNANTSLIDEVHIIVEDEDGLITGNKGEVIEAFDGLSRVVGAKTSDGADNYYKTVLRDVSEWIYYANETTALSGSSSSEAKDLSGNISTHNPESFSFDGGSDGSVEGTALLASGIQTALDKFKNKEDIDIQIIMAGQSTQGTNDTQIANYIIDNISSVRKDCMACVSPARADVINNAGGELDAIIAFRNSLTSSSFAVCDTGYKYQYDKFSDVYRYVPLNGDIGGTMARTDHERDFFFSPAGFARGSIKNVVKLAYTPVKADRDELYKRDINPVVTLPGHGVILFGDKTLLGRPSAFDRITVSYTHLRAHET